MGEKKQKTQGYTQQDKQEDQELLANTASVKTLSEPLMWQMSRLHDWKYSIQHISLWLKQCKKFKGTWLVSTSRTLELTNIEMLQCPNQCMFPSLLHNTWNEKRSSLSKNSLTQGWPNKMGTTTVECVHFFFFYKNYNSTSPSWGNIAALFSWWGASPQFPLAIS